MIEKEIVFLGESFNDSEEFLQEVSNKLVSLGYVSDSFSSAILERESIYPTGLRTEKYGVAIPHTDSIHVLKPGVVFVRFDQSCLFKEMCTNNVVDVDMAFVLLVKDKEEQVGMLTKLMGFFSKIDILDQLYNETNIDQICQLLNNELN